MPIEAYRQAVQRGARAVREPTKLDDEHGVVELASIATYGDTIHTFVDRFAYGGPFLPGFVSVSPNGRARSAGLLSIDHIVGNVELGRMDQWVEFYERVFGMTNILHFGDDQIQTEYSALMSKVMSDGAGKIKFPINEAAEGKRKSQIEEYIEFYNGAAPSTSRSPREHRRDGRRIEEPRDPLPRDSRHLLRGCSGARRDRRGLRGAARAQDPRRPRRGRLSPPDFHEDGTGSAHPVLRSDRAPRCARFRRRQLQGCSRRSSASRRCAGTSKRPLHCVAKTRAVPRPRLFTRSSAG